MPFLGGGIFNEDGTASLTNCTLAGNSAVAGGAISNESPFASSRTSAIHLRNCTLSGNTITSQAGTIIDNENSTNDFVDARLDLTGCTLNGSGNNGASGIYEQSSGVGHHTQITLANCILNQCPLRYDEIANGSAGIFSLGYNLSNDSGSGVLGGNLANGTDQINTDPGLDPLGLQNNGGPTQTIALTFGSAAIDKGKSFGSTTDQRGVARPYDNASIPNASGGDGSDIGAYEAPQDPQQSGVPSFIVTTTDDHNDGVCSGADCTLREAIQAVGGRGSGTITFASNVTGTITLQALLGELDVNGSATIIGPGARVLAVSGNENHRVFGFNTGTSTVFGLTIRDGWMAGGATGASNLGGGVLNQATLTLNDCAFTNNFVAGVSAGASSGNNGGSGQGGGIYNAGTLTLNRCTFYRITSGNVAGGGNGGADLSPLSRGGAGGSGQGGAVFNALSSTLFVNNCTFNGNSAAGGSGGTGTQFGGNGGAANGGAICNQGTMTVTACTLSGNFGSSGLGAHGGISNGFTPSSSGCLAALSGSSVVMNSISAGNTGSFGGGNDADGAFTSNGYNLIGTADHSSGFTVTGDQTGTDAAKLDAKVGALQDNGGPTDTMALLINSPAIDQGKSFGLTTDQRSFLRPQDNLAINNATGGDGSDIGAFESEIGQIGATLKVTNTFDHDDGLCGLSDCTLREAINAANALAGDNVITFAPGVSGTIQLSAALPNLSTNINVQGPGANVLTVRRNTAGIYRIFTVSNGTSSGPTVSISGLTIANGTTAGGSLPDSGGGGILGDSAALTVSNCTLDSNTARYGGGIFNLRGALNVNNCSLNQNSVTDAGGGIYNYGFGGGGNVNVSNSTLSSNTAPGSSGGAIYNYAAASTVINSTISGNSAFNGGAIFNEGSGTITSLTLLSCTLSGNSTANAASGNVYNNGAFGGSATLTISNTIFKTGASGPNILNNVGTVVSQGYNLSNDAAGGDGSIGPGGFLNATGDIRNTDPLLGPLANNGGPTLTHAFPINSPVLDKGKSFGLPFDQRGLLRTADSPVFANATGGDGTDIGAVEFYPLGGVDTDGDGMSDDFETFYGVSDPNGDPDGDGLTNLQEFQAGTNPLDPLSALRIIAVARSGNNLTVTFSLAVAGKMYRLERKDALTDAFWSSISGVADLTVVSTGSAQLTDLGGASVTKHFYHVRVLP